MNDVQATSKCFFKLIDMGIIKLEFEINKHNEKIANFKNKSSEPPIENIIL